jgi:hypothetical protein
LFVSDNLQLQDEDFVADKDDSGSPTDDSGEEGSDASLSGGEKEVTHFTHAISLISVYNEYIMLINITIPPLQRNLPKRKLVAQRRL